MHKIKKGIKKKIKGKKEKNDEIFTPAELEKYKKEKEEEARRLAGHQEETNEEKENQPLDSEPLAGATATPAASTPSSEQQEGPSAVSETQETSSSTSGKEDWRNFFAATDTVLKKTTDNLVHIKEASYFQKKEERVVEPVHKEVENQELPAVVAAAPATSSSKGWVDLERGGIDEETEEQPFEEVKESEEPEPEKEPELAPLQFIEDLPDVDVDDFTEVFDTTYVDNVESGQVKLHYIPDSPITENPNEPDPFDTSVVDRVLHTEQPKPKKQKHKKNKQEPPKQPEKKKKLVSLGCAVEVLTGQVQSKEKPTAETKPDPKRRRVVPKEVNLFADAFGEENVAASEEEITGENAEDSNLIEDILCAPDTTEIPDTGITLCPTPRAVSPSVISEEEKGKETDVLYLGNDIEGDNKEVDLSEFLESNGEDQDDKENKQDSGKDLDLKDLVAEFDIIDKSEVTNEDLIPAEPDIEDEFDAEFAFLAAESVAKSKDKEFTDLEDDPFDTSAAAHVLGPEETAETEKDPFDVGFAEAALEGDSVSGKAAKPPPPRPAPPTNQKDPEEVDPFDTSVADKHLPVDPFATPATAEDLPETLQPQADLVNSSSFDPFDTSIAETFGKTELKVLETELLTSESGKQLKEEELDDFDFDPRADEPETKPKSPPCLLTSGEEVASGPVLEPSQNKQEEEFDPFDTSIAKTIVIQTLEAELLSDSTQVSSETKKQLPPRPPPSPGHIFATTPTDTNPALQPSNLGDKNSKTQINTEDDSNFDPFDTSIAENFGKTELKALENELLTKSEPQKLQKTEQEKPDAKSLELPIKPLRPPSPKCLLAATPVDEFPTLEPTLEPSDTTTNNQAEDFDPFDTSIAEQFGKTELKVLESELLVTAGTKGTGDFNTKSEDSVSTKPSKPSRPPSPAPPQCLLTATPAGTPPGSELLAPTGSKELSSSEDIDPFDTSIADKFGKTELKHLETELLSGKDTAVATFDDFNPRDLESPKPCAQSKLKPGRPPVPGNPCLLATTPTDQSATLQPFLKSEEPKEGVTPEDFDPFDTTIAGKLCKTEIKALEENLFSNNSTEPKPNQQPNLQTNERKTLPLGDARRQSVDKFLSSSPTADLGPTLQPVQDTKQVEEAEFDPFDTTIADKFGKTELKSLESELLSDSGVKRNLSDDEFDPREEEAIAPKRPPPPDQKPSTPVHLLDSSEDSSVTVQPILASQAQSTTDTLEDYDPFDTSIASNIGPSKAELKYLESELLSAAQDPFDTSNIA